MTRTPVTARAPGGRPPERSVTAAAFLEEIAATPGRQMIASVAGSRGSGKSSLLDDVEAEYVARGVPVRRDSTQLDLDTTEPGVVLIDDAHLLSERELEELGRFVASGQGGLVVSHRIGPLSPGLQRLVATIGRYHHPIVLGVFTRDDIALRLASGSGVDAEPAVLEQLEALTGGMPWILDRMLRSIPAASLTDPAALVSQAVLDQVGFELERLDPELRRLLLALAVGYDLSVQIPPGLENAGERMHALIDEARAAGLLLPGGQLVPLVRVALLRTMPLYQVRATQRALVDAVASTGSPLGGIAKDLARDGLKDPRVAEELERAADDALLVDPALAYSLYGEAESAGSDPIALAARRAQAAFTMGDVDGAGRILDNLLARETVPDHARALDTAAAVWANRGMLARSAEVYAWSGQAGGDAFHSMAMIAKIGTGDLSDATELGTPPGAGAMPTVRTVALRLMAEGIRSSVGDTPSEALASLVRASDMMNATGIRVPLPDSAAALATLVALHSGELAVAESVLDAAVHSEQGGLASRPRLLLLQAWTAMQRDDLDRSRTLASEAMASPLSPRERLLCAALEVGVARRADNAPALVEAWGRARDTLLHVPIDLYSIMPLAELVIAGARVRESHRLAAHFADAWALLHQLGDPPLWSIRLHWSAVQAAILTERPDELAPHAAALVAASQHNPLARVLATAGREWVSVLSGQFDPNAVESAARALASVGLTWDGSRLCGHGAARATDRRAMSRLLACARDLHPSGSRTPDAGTGQPATGPQDGGRANQVTLSAREREVAQLVVDGKTYREIGEAIFVSPRTAEHHIARIRERLGATTRSDLLARLRALLADSARGTPADRPV